MKTAKITSSLMFLFVFLFFGLWINPAHDQNGIAMVNFQINTASATEDRSKDDNDSNGFCDCPNFNFVICHSSPGKSDGKHTIRVGAPAVDAHMEHHADTLGPCPFEHDEDAVTYTTGDVCICENGSLGVWYITPNLSSPGSTKSVRSIEGQ